MRNAFIDALNERARRDTSLFLAIGDLGYGVVDNFAEELPLQFLNAGVAEQNMIGVSAGLASAGRHVFAYSIANFPTFRALEQVRNDVCYHKLPVTIVSVGAGLGYGVLGYSHFAVEDLAIMRALPNIEVYSPIDSFDAVRCLDEIIERRTPSYIRLGKGGEKALYQSSAGVDIGWNILRKGNSTWVVVSGSIAENVLAAVDAIKISTGEDIGVLALNKIKPLTLPINLLRSDVKLITVEEHSLVGGLRSAVLEEIANLGISGLSVHGIGITEPAAHVIGSQAFVREFHGLSVEKLSKSIHHFAV